MKFLNLLLFLTLSLMFVSCSDEDKDNAHDYYVKYTVSLVGQNYPRIEYNVSTDQGVQTFYTTEHSFEKVYGPVKSGFVANINFDCSELKGYAGAYGSATIEISRDNEPFSIKATEQYKTNINLTYKIE